MSPSLPFLRVKAHHQRGPGYDQILKKNEQLYALLAISCESWLVQTGGSALVSLKGPVRALHPLKWWSGFVATKNAC